MLLINLMVTTCYRLQKYTKEDLKRNKLTKWGFKLWVLADKIGYTVNVRSSVMLQYNRKSTIIIIACGIIVLILLE